MERISGLPAHPLIVHTPVVLLPLAAIGVVCMMIRPAWYEKFRWPVLAIAVVGMIGAILAASSGEGLEEMIEDTEGRAAVRAIHEHAAAGELARTASILFVVVLTAWVLLPWFLRRRAAARPAAGTAAPDGASRPASAGPGWLRPLLMAGVALTAVFSMVTIVNAGHSGAKDAWEELSTTSAGDD